MYRLRVNRSRLLPACICITVVLLICVKLQLLTDFNFWSLKRNDKKSVDTGHIVELDGLREKLRICHERINVDKKAIIRLKAELENQQELINHKSKQSQNRQAANRINNQPFKHMNDKHKLSVDEHHDNILANAGAISSVITTKPKPADVKNDANEAKKFHSKDNQIITGQSSKDAVAIGQFHEFKGQKLVHLDLKGAPPTINYLRHLLPLFKKLGATGLLIEYEDMFPYSGNLRIVARPEAYTLAQIGQLHDLAAKYKLSIVPLLQTFGHMEFVLKHPKFADLNEDRSHKMVLCTSCHNSNSTVEDMITQIMNAHPHAQYLHIGGDEVYDLYKSNTSRMNFGSKEELYVSHILHLSQYIKNRWPNVQVMIWDDMLRNWPVNSILALKNHVIPMVWAYWSNLDNYFPVDMWERYEQVFNEIWIASAYKGAGGSSNDFPPIHQHIGNHEAWIKIVNSLRHTKLNFSGIALTGWSRYDHFANMVELLPAGLTSLALCLNILRMGKFNHQVIANTSMVLGCKKPVTVAINRKYKAETCKFYGWSAFHAIGIYYQGIIHYDRAQGVLPTWATSFQVKHDRISLFRLEAGYMECLQSKKYLLDAKKLMPSALSKLYYQADIDEWMTIKIKSKLRELKKLTDNILGLMQKPS